ncbi:MAG: hypothetical protein LBD97_03430 [Bifidobacteriaceae bacterium]|nr:hypothetical protein [Bifidobacteriaceae bacterium]
MKRACAVVTCAVGVLVVVGAGLRNSMAAEGADAGRVVFTVNSTALEANGSDCSGGGVCTLREALRAADAADPAADVLIRADVDGKITFPKSNLSLPVTGSVTPWDTQGALFHVKRPVEIDLGDRLGLATVNGSVSAPAAATAAMLVDAPKVKLRNFSNWFSYQSVIVFSDQSDGSSLIGGESIQTDNNHTNRQVVIMAGADNITVSHYTMGRQSSETGSGGIALTRFSGGSVGTVSGAVISNVVIDNKTSASAACGTSDGKGCSASGLYLSNSVAVDGLRVENSDFKNFWLTDSGFSAFNAVEGGALTNWQVEGNRFTDTRSGSLATLQLPTRASLPGPVHIRRNVFDNGASPSAQKQAIAFARLEPEKSTSASGLFIEDNHFDGYAQTIRLQAAGTVTVRRNTMGAASGSWSGSTIDSNWDPFGTVGEEFRSDTENIMFANQDNRTNRWIATFWPYQAKVQGCSISFRVMWTQNTASQIWPEVPADVDVYWTATTKAEVYLGTLKGFTQQDLYTLDVAPPAAGRIRLQSQGLGQDSLLPEQQESSQYSRLAAVDAATGCKPDVRIELDAWVDVPADVTSYDELLASTATRLGDGATIRAGGEVWFSYKVTNTGPVRLRRVLVSDNTPEASVCVLADLAAYSQAGCIRRTVVR